MLKASGPEVPNEMLEIVANLDIMLVTPDMAKAMLKKNIFKDQRNITQSVVDRYAAAMINGTWDETLLCPICTTPDEILLDAQHRLLAVIQADRPIWFYVNRRAKEEQFAYIDSGKPRTLSDRCGVPNSKSVSAIARVGACLELGATISMAMHSNVPLSARNGFVYVKQRKNTIVPLTLSEGISYLRGNEPLLEHLVLQSKRIKRAVGHGTEKQLGSALLIVNLCAGSFSEDYFVDFVLDEFDSVKSIFLTPKQLDESPSAKPVQKTLIELVELLYCFDYLQGKVGGTVNHKSLQNTLSAWDDNVLHALESKDAS